MQQILSEVKEASNIIKNTPALLRSEVILRIADLIEESAAKILKENAMDMANAKSDNLSSAMQDRLLLTEKRLKDIAESTRSIARQEDPIGEVLEGNIRPNGLNIIKVRVPIGVIGIIYESRPNVTVDCAALCLRSGNSAILRGGKEAYHSNKAFADIIRKALKECGLPENAVVLLNDPDRSKMLAMIQAINYVDLVIPRGGEGLIKFVSKNAHVPVIKHDKGLCVIFVDESAKLDRAIDIVENAKVTRPSVCNAVETLLVHKKIAESFLPMLAERLSKVTVKGCPTTLKIIKAEPANDVWDEEHLDYILTVKVVNDVEEAIAHITKYSSAHSDAILTENYTNAELFLSKVDSACVYVNASTRFTDGGEFGYGAEVGISTEKLHSRGPMGAFDLTTTKFKIYGNGQIR